MDSQRQIAAWREIIGSDASWVAFQNGTCVFIETNVADLAETARQILREKGPLGTSNSASPIPLSDELGWIVAFDFPDMLALVLPEEVVANAEVEDIGKLGLKRRAADADSLEVVHLEDKRSA